MAIRVRRIYDQPERGDGLRVLVDRLWPRGLRKDGAGIDHWLREVAPSDELRRWYGHRPERFERFAARYREELRRDEAAEALRELRGLARRGTVTLLTGTKDLDRSNAAVLADVLGGERRAR